ncbi:hypothetical protein VTO42DRAFT_2997 [Malbranchea cinnamomea]
MSSLRNAVHRRQHRERAQPEFREKWGLLEKHKDYSLRAKDYNLKKAKLQRLREKARDRNPDEFAFGMVSSTKKIKQGRHGAREDSTLSMETVGLLKTQDAGYLRVMGEKVRRKMEELEKEIKLQEGIQGALDGDVDMADEDDEGSRVKKSKKLLFVDSVEEQRRRAVDHSGSDEDDDEDMSDDEENEGYAGLDDASGGKKEERKSRKEIEEEALLLKEIRAARNKKKRAAEARLRKLEALKKQHRDIVAAERELDWQRARMENSVGGINKNGVRWKVRERKK